MQDLLALGVTRVHGNGTQERWELTAFARCEQPQSAAHDVPATPCRSRKVPVFSRLEFRFGVSFESDTDDSNRVFSIRNRPAPGSPVIRKFAAARDSYRRCGCGLLFAAALPIGSLRRGTPWL